MATCAESLGKNVLSVNLISKKKVVDIRERRFISLRYFRIFLNIFKKIRKS